MAILDYARSIQDMTKFGPSGMATYYEKWATVDTAHPFLLGTYPPFQDTVAHTLVEGRYAFDFSADAAKPVLGDVFGFRYSRLVAYVGWSGQPQTPQQWLFQFKDAAGNTIGGLRHSATSTTQIPQGRSYELVAGSTIVTIAGNVIFDQTLGLQDYGITCMVSASTITVAMYRNTVAQSLTGASLSLVNSVTMSNTALNYGPVAVMKITPNVATTSTVSYPDLRNGADHSAYVGCAFTVNEDVANLFVSNVLTLTGTGATLTDLPLLSSISAVETNNYAQMGAYFQSVRDSRRSFKLAPIGAHVFPASNHQIVRMKIEVSYGLSVAAKASFANASDLEFFTRYSSTNYSNGRFGKNTGMQTFEISYNPTTLLPFDNYTSVELGIVLREKT